MEKTEIRTLAQKKKWKGLQSKFERPDFFEDDPTIPPETIIYFSKEKSRVRLILSMFNIALGLFFLIILDNFVLGTIIFISGIYLSFKAYYKSINTTAQIVLNQKGIKTVTTRFFRWSKIEEEEVIKEASRRRSDFYLTYKHPEGNEKIRINDYTIGSKELDDHLNTYCRRYNSDK